MAETRCAGSTVIVELEAASALVRTGHVVSAEGIIRRMRDTRAPVSDEIGDALDCVVSQLGRGDTGRAGATIDLCVRLYRARLDRGPLRLRVITGGLSEG